MMKNYANNASDVNVYIWMDVASSLHPGAVKCMHIERCTSQIAKYTDRKTPSLRVPVSSLHLYTESFSSFAYKT